MMHIGLIFAYSKTISLNTYAKVSSHAKGCLGTAQSKICQDTNYPLAWELTSVWYETTSK